MAISRICGIIVLYKFEFEKLKMNRNSKIPINFENEISKISKISSLNQFILTFCSALWKNTLFCNTNNNNVQTSISLPM
jgi:hypothetical protein